MTPNIECEQSGGGPKRYRGSGWAVVRRLKVTSGNGAATHSGVWGYRILAAAHLRLEPNNRNRCAVDVFTCIRAISFIHSRVSGFSILSPRQSCHLLSFGCGGGGGGGC